MTPKPGTPETRMTRAPPPHLVIRTIRDWAGVRMDDRPIRRAVVIRMGEPPAPVAEEERRSAREAHLAQASVIASATIAAAQAFQQVLQSSQPATTKEEV